MQIPVLHSESNKYFVLLLCILLITVAQAYIDIYLPALPNIAKSLNASNVAVKLTT